MTTGGKRGDHSWGKLPIVPVAIHTPPDSRNPYQRLLTDALARQGIQAVLARTSDVLPTLKSANGNPKVLHIHWLPRGFVGFGNLLEFLRFRRMVQQARQAGASIFWTAHNLYSHESHNRGRERRLTRFIINQADGVVVHSPRAADMVRAAFGVKPDKQLRAIPHGNYIGCYANTISESDARNQLGLLDRHKVILFLGNIRPYKGVLELLAAFLKIRDPDARLIIAGLPKDEATRHSVVAASASDPRVVLRLGFVPDDDIQMYMQASNVVVLPYLNVLTSGAAVLAMSFGRACIAPSSGCLPDYLCEQSQLLYTPDYSDGLSKCLTLALENLSYLREAGASNLKKAREWSWDTIAQHTVNFYFSGPA